LRVRGRKRKYRNIENIEKKMKSADRPILYYARDILVGGTPRGNFKSKVKMSRGVSARNGTQGRYNTLIGFE
jgi:hypothetical protein